MHDDGNQETTGSSVDYHVGFAIPASIEVVT